MAPSRSAPHRTVVVAGLLLVAIAASVTVVVVRRASSGGDAAGPSPTAWQKVMSGADDSGDTTVEMAREAFSLTFEPLSGVRVPSGSRRDVQSGSAALRMMIAHWSELTVDERTTLLSYLYPNDLPSFPSDGAPTPPSPTGATGSTQGASEAASGRGIESVAFIRPTRLPVTSGPGPDAATKQMIATRLGALRTAIGAHAGKFLTGKVDLSYNTREVEAGSAAYTFPHSTTQTAVNPTPTTASLDGAGGPYGGCLIYLNPYGWQLRGTSLDFVLAHELYHCFEGMFIGDTDVFYDKATAPSWVIEGGANWAAAQVVPTSTFPSAAWQSYLLSPSIPLFAQSYEAIGFWNHLDESTPSDPWAAIRDALGKPSTAALAQTGALADPFLDSWASSLFRQPRFGASWQTDGPTMISVTISPDDERVTNGSRTSRAARAHAKAVLYANVQSDVVVIVGIGHVSLHNATHDAARFGQLVYCARDDGCDCPAGSVNTSAAPSALGGSLVAFGVTGSSRASAVALGGISLAEWCKKKDPPKSKRPEGGADSGGAADPVDPNASLCHQIIEREGIDGLLTHPSMSPQDIQDCLAEMLASAGY